MATAPLPPVASAPAPETAPLSEGARIVNTFIAPSKTFTDLRRSAMWWGPFVLLAIVTVAFTFSVEKKIGYRKIAEDQVQMIPKVADQFEKMTPEQREQQYQQRAKGALIFAYAKSVLRIVWFAIIAGLLFATFRFAAGVDLSYKTALAVVVYASLPMVIQLILGIASLLAGVSPDAYSPDNPVASNPAYFMNPADSLVRYAAAAPFDLFAIWTLILTAIGFTCISKVKRGTALAIVFGWYAVACLIGVAVSAAFS